MPSLAARKLRTTPTDAEIRLWSRLRRKQLEGYRFRRQQPMGPFVVDFFCPEAKLIVEVDGGQHAESASDERRTSWLEANGYRVVRFWNNDVLANTEGVLMRILEALRAGPPSLPSPSRGEGVRELNEGGVP
jgi:very-short-patch-repair endonuclease